MGGEVLEIIIQDDLSQLDNFRASGTTTEEYYDEEDMKPLGVKITIHL